MATNLTAVALNCTLKSGPDESSTDLLLAEVAAELRSHGVEVAPIIRVADHDVKPGVTSDEGDGDDWPAIRRQVLDADIVVIGTPIWLGQPSSIAHRVMERMDAFLGETDDEGRMVSYGRVAMVAVVGNEDGAHHVSAELFQAMNDVGFTIAANAVTYWVGEAMQGTDYKDLDERPETTARATRMSVRNTVHLAGLLKGSQYPGGE
ncbi:flavodoxin family protein [Actinomarinicola tropica]|uniref:NADPH-dependent oxidoreductase n=1 Tax=Actinomarinicola tropica TaxID=2789776 RepID=A0A5Q2RML5_9ACTN|nr:flavodoxin family protein [Actinomarinicola tropica]QGG94425.1 NADPH-dependent oxidoreductase [Actinomarinicola tropica]